MNARDELLDFIVDQIPGSALADFQASDQARQRVWALIAKERESGLLPEEKLELDDYMKLEHLLVLAQTLRLRQAVNSKQIERPILRQVQDRL